MPQNKTTRATKRVKDSLTTATREVAKTLKDRHGIDVPHSALRDSLASAVGVSSQSFKAQLQESASRIKALETQLVRYQALIKEAPVYFHPGYDFDGKKLAWLEQAGLVEPNVTPKRSKLSKSSKNAPAPASTSGSDTVTVFLSLVANELGALCELSLDPWGRYRLPDGYKFAPGTSAAQSASVPRISRYGVPPYVSSAKNFYSPWGLDVKTELVHDMQDDSADNCVLALELSQTEASRLHEAVESSCQTYALEFEATVPALSPSGESVAEQMAKFTRIVHEDGAVPLRALCVHAEWVYPDEDGDCCMALLDLTTGSIELLGDVPSDAHSSVVRKRIWASDDLGEEVETGIGHDWEVRVRKPGDGTATWFLDERDLGHLNELLNRN